MKRAILLLFVGTAAAFAQAGQATDGGRWKGIDFLLGKWAGEGSGQPGAGSGEFSFAPELAGRIVVRRSYNQLEKERHEDLLIIYADAPEAPLHAIYFDSEGHVIRYRVATPKPNTAVFESDGTQPGPRYRLTYELEGKVLRGGFEVAPPGSEYKKYLTWTAAKQRHPAN